MIVNILILLSGLALIVLGADWLVDGASSIARKFGISEFVIGLTIVGFGTSMPELVVSLNGAFNGASDIAVGNVVGSNIFNTLMILGLTAIVMPIEISEKNRKRDIPITLGVTVLLILTGMRNTFFHIGRNELTIVYGILFIIIFLSYLIYCFKTGKVEDTDETDTSRTHGIFISVILVIAGLAGLVFGGRFFVDSAQSIAKAIGVSDKFIAITVLAGGTSLPELATCIVAAVKKHGQLALGNILGSNIFNILLILGCSALVAPISFEGMNVIDMSVLFASIAIVSAGAYTFSKDKLDRAEGIILITLFVVYYFWLFQKL